jgi:mRNA-degrading endonuclease RelE of RelBE toxin-antitoxin system
MDRVEKFIRKIGKKRAPEVIALVTKVLENNLGFLDVKKLAGEKDIYRVKVGRIRIKYEKVENLNIIVHIGFRDDNTY